MGKFELACWWIALIAGFAVSAFGFIYIFSRKTKKEVDFAITAVIEYLASFILLIPEVLFHEVQSYVPVISEIESLFRALMHAFSIYSGNGVQRITIEGHAVLSGIYAIVMAVANLALIASVTCFVFRFIESLFHRANLFLHKKQYTYLFSACNEKTLAIAASIVPPEGITAYNIIFAGINNEHDSSMNEQVQSIKEKIQSIHGVYIENSVEEILMKLKSKSEGFEIFLFGEEKQNLIDLDRICENLTPQDYLSPIKIYVELYNTPWNVYQKYFSDHITKPGNGEEKFVINFLRTEENFAYNHLLKYSIFENAIESITKTEKDIKILIVGMNARNVEMLKAVLHLGQMPGYRITVMVLDGGKGKAVLNCKMPEIKLNEKVDKYGDAFYHIIYHEEVNFETDQFEEIIEGSYLDFTFAFINVEDDILNANLGMRLNALCYQKNKDNVVFGEIKKNAKENGNNDENTDKIENDDIAGNTENRKYKIQVIIRNQEMCNKWDSDLTKHLEFVGDIKDTYNYSFITMSDIEKATIAIHYVRYPKENKKNPSWNSYCNNEYNRHSVYARTLSLKYKVKVIEERCPENPDYNLTATDEEWKIYEHMRWNVYTRTIGYRCAESDILNADGEVEKSVRFIAKVHHDLVTFDELKPKEQAKDGLKIDDKILEVLKSI